MSSGGDHSAFVLGMLKGVFKSNPEITGWNKIAGISAGALLGTKISQIKKGTAIVNTSRGEIWDELQIVEALKKNQLAAVATDVIDNETLGYEKSPIWEARFEDNMLITPHIGGASFDAMWDCEEHIQKLFIKKFLNEKN